jgi:hypothetical protein
MEPFRIGQSSIAVHEWAALIASETPDVDACAAGATFTRQDLACIVYTSGTGGAPRGVMQHHGAVLHNVEGCIDVIANDFGLGDEVFLSFLPASHAYEHSGGQMFPIGLGAQIYYSEGLEKLASNIEEVRPTIMVGRAAPVRGAAPADPEECREAGPAQQLSDAARARDRRQGLSGFGAALGPADGVHPPKDAAAENLAALRRAHQGDGLGRGAAQSGRRGYSSTRSA